MKIEIADLLSSKWSVRVCDLLFTYPKIKGSLLHLKTEMPKNTASLYIRKLTDEGINVQQVPSAGRKAGMYSFEPLLELDSVRVIV